MSVLQCLRAQTCKLLPVKNVHDSMYTWQYTYIYKYVYTIQNLLQKFPENAQTNQVSNHVNCSLNMRINKFSKSIKLQSRQILPLFFLSSPKSHKEIYFPTNAPQALMNTLWWGTESPLAS